MGKTIAEGKGQPFVKVPVFWSARKCQSGVILGHEADAARFAEGQQLRYCGVGAGYEDVIIDGDLDAMKVRACDRICCAVWLIWSRRAVCCVLREG